MDFGSNRLLSRHFFTALASSAAMLVTACGGTTSASSPDAGGARPEDGGSTDGEGMADTWLLGTRLRDTGQIHRHDVRQRQHHHGRRALHLFRLRRRPASKSNSNIRLPPSWNVFSVDPAWSLRARCTARASISHRRRRRSDPTSLDRTEG
jgi:hypothetical protein